jgi:hypothetical protein
MKKVILCLVFMLSAYVYADMYDEAQFVTGCPAWILRGIAMTESSCNPSKVGDDGISIGMFQINETFHEERARKYGEYNPLNPEQAILIAGHIMAHNLKVFRNPRNAIAAYRQGVAGVIKNGRTDWYVNKVIKYGKHHTNTV